MLDILLVYCFVSYVIVLVWLGNDYRKTSGPIHMLWNRLGFAGRLATVIAVLVFIIAGPLSVWYIVFRKEDHV